MLCCQPKVKGKTQAPLASLPAGITAKERAQLITGEDIPKTPPV